MITLMRPGVLKVVDKKVKNRLQWVMAMNHHLVEKILLLVGIYLLVDNKTKKIVQIIQLHQGVNLRTMNKNHLQWVMAMSHLLVMKSHLLVIPSRLQVKHLQLIMVEMKLLQLRHRLLDRHQVGHLLLDRHQVGHRLLDRHQVGHRLRDHKLYS